MPVTRSRSASRIASVTQRASPTSPKPIKSTASAFTVPPRVVEPQLLPATLSFSLEEAKKHLVSVDSRFQDVFDRLDCKPYQNLQPTDPFRALVTSILGQQISWLAARSITHRFIRLYFPSLPEAPPPPGDDANKLEDDVFPTAHQVAATEISVIRSAGLSERKAQYVLDVACRFSDGRLSTEKFLNATDDELAEILIEVKGIGMWTVHMFSIFSLKRPNILPVGDLGVQRGLVRWFYHWHNPDRLSASVPLSPKKLSRTKSHSLPTPSTSQRADPIHQGGLDLSATHSEAAPEQLWVTEDPTDTAKSASHLSTSSARDGLQNGRVSAGKLSQPPPLPTSLSLKDLKSRLQGQKIKGAFLTPKEMEELTECWKPWRSIGVYYMWSLAEESK